MSAEQWQSNSEMSEQSAAGPVDSPRNKQHSYIFSEVHKRIDQIRSQEEQSEIADFIKGNAKQLGLDKTQQAAAINKLIAVQNDLRVENSGFKIWDDQNLPMVSKLLRDSFAERGDEQAMRATNLTESNALTASNYLDTLQAQGMHNTAIIQQMLDAHESGEIKILPQKLQQYRNFLALLTENDFADDRAVIRKVINSSSIDLDDPSSFEQVLQSLTERPDISALTKERISARFSFRKLETGHDLKVNLSKRKEQRAQVEHTLETIHNNQTILQTEKDVLEAEIESIRESLRLVVDNDSRFELETELKALKQRLGEVEEAMLTLQAEEEETVLPTEAIAVRMGRATLVDGIIHLHLPSTGRELILPELENGQLVGQVVNSYFVYENLRKYGLERALFPEHKLGSSDLPSANIVTKTNNMLALLGLHNTGAIATEEDLEVLDDTLKVFRSREDIDTKRQQNTDEAELDLTALGLLNQESFNWESFGEALEFLRVNRKPELHSFEGVSSFLKSGTSAEG